MRQVKCFASDLHFNLKSRRSKLQLKSAKPPISQASTDSGDPDLHHATPNVRTGIPHLQQHTVVGHVSSDNLPSVVFGIRSLSLRCDLDLDPLFSRFDLDRRPLFLRNVAVVALFWRCFRLQF